jgi:hypothetical protein
VSRGISVARLVGTVLSSRQLKSNSVQSSQVKSRHLDGAVGVHVAVDGRGGDGCGFVVVDAEDVLKHGGLEEVVALRL